MKRSPYLFRLLLFSFCLSVVPVIFLGLYSFSKASETIQVKVNESNNYLIEQTQMRVEQLMKAIDSNTTQAIESPLIRKAITDSLSYESYDQINDVIKSLLHIQSYELRISEVELDSFENHWMIDKGGFYQSVNPALQDLISRIQKTSVWLSDAEAGLNHDAYPGVNLLKNVPVNSSSPDGAILIHVPYLELSRMLDGSDKAQLMILDRNYRIIGSSQISKLGQQLPETGMLEQLSSAESLQGQFRTKYQGEGSTVFYLKSTYNGWSYVSVVPNAAITKDSRMIGWATFWVCLLILIAIAVSALLGSKRMYTPIKQIYESVKNRAGGAVDGKRTDELLFIGQNIEVMFSSQNEMKSLLQAQKRHLRDYFVVKLMNGELTSSEIDEKIDQYEFPRWTQQAVLALQIDSLEHTKYSDRDRDLLMFAIHNIVSELVPESDRFNPVMINSYQVTLVGESASDSSLFKEHVHRMARSIQEAAEKYLSLKVSIGVSRAFAHPRLAPAAFKEATEALKYRVRLGEEAILDISDIKLEKERTQYYPKHLSDELLHSVQHLDQARSSALIGEWLRSLQPAPLSYREYQASLARLLSNLIGLVQDEGIHFQPLFEQDGANLFDQLFRMKTPEDIEQWFVHKIIEPIIETLRTNRETQEVHLSIQVIQLIHEYFDTNLTLEWCASRLNYTTDYIRKVFRKETGTNFSDYLANYRHLMAKKWLAESDAKINDIAERLSYNNTQNFIRNFRKLEGITPGQYRTQLRG